MTNKNAQKLIDKIIEGLHQNGIITNPLIEDLKTLRPFAVHEKRPVVAKTIRLVYEHVAQFDTFTIPIPDEEDIVDEETGKVLVSDENQSSPTESLLYLMSLIKNEEHKRNKQEIRLYNEALQDYMDEFGE